MTPITPWLIVLAVALVVALVALLLYWLWRRGGGALPGGAARPSVALWRQGLQALASADAGADPYDLPCVLVSGDAGAGKSALLRGAGLDAVCVPPEQPQPSGWWRNSDGSVFELPAAAAEATRAGRTLWLALLRLLERGRGRRPLDAVVWVLPLAALAPADGADAAAADAAFQAQAGRLRRQLADLQNRLGQQLPLYVVVSKCDQVDGFGAFAARLSAPLVAQTLGWSNPNALGRAFQADWVRQGLAAIARQLRAVVSELGVQLAGDPDYERLYLMPDKLAAALARLPELLQLALRQQAGLAGCDLRGVYLSGRTEAAAAGADPYATIAPAAETPVLFCAQLFERRVFGEFGLARPLYRRISGTRTARLRLTIGVGVAALLWLACLLLTYSHDWQQAASMVPPLTAVKDQLNRADGNPTDQPSDIPALLKQMDAVQNWTFDDYPLAWSMPLSLNSHYTNRIRRALQLYYERVVFTNMDRALDAKAQALVPDASCDGRKAASPGAAPPTPAATLTRLGNYIDQTQDYEAQYQRFARLSNEKQGDWGDASVLIQYLFGIPAVHRTPVSERAFDDIIRVSHYDPMHQPPGERFVCRLMQLHQAWLDQQFGRESLTALLARLHAALVQFSHGELDERAPLEQLRGDIGQLRALLANSGQATATDNALGTSEHYRELLKKIGASTLLGGLKRQAVLEADANEAQQDLVDKLDAVAGGDDPVLALAAGKMPALMPAIDELEAALDLLLRHPFAQTAAATPPDAVAEWDLAGLDAVPALLQDYQAYETTELSKAPPRFRAALQQVARAQASAAISNAIAAAALLPGQGASGGARGDNFDQAQKQLLPLLLALRKLDHPKLAAQWERVLGDQAQQLLAALDARLAGAALYAADAALIDGWDGQPQAAQMAFNTASPAELQDYLAAQAAQAGELAGAARAPRAWLERGRAGKGGSLAQIDAELARYAAKNPAGSLRQLEQLITVDLNGIDAANCGERLPKLARRRDGDYFQQRGQALVRQFTERCAVLQLSLAHQSYARIASYYNQNLAERYPFASRADAAPADPEQVRELLRLLDQHYAAAHDGLARLHDAGLQAARAFLDKLGAARPLLAAVLAIDPVGGGPAALDLWPEFRINRARERGGDQIIDWRLASGDDGAAGAAPAAPLPMAWRLGDPLALTLRWAKDGELSPAPDPARDPAMVVSAKSAQWNYGGRWALLQLLSEHAAPLSELGPRDATMASALRFEVPTRHADGQPGPATLAYARLGVSLHGKPERLAATPLPTTAAPPLPGGAAHGATAAGTP